ncbi:MAG TPA: zinc ABC transporter substrate-binding protein [Mycobacteriales bacterium]|nr:zinc ABC transporter substrate-binding protein [Mycobacteriales bacterium]
MLRRLAPVVLLFLLALTACGGGDDTSGRDKPTVVVGAYPFAWLVQQVVGDTAEVVTLVKPGVEPHDVELTPKQVAQLQGRVVVIYLKGFQPAVDDAVAGRGNAYDLGAVVHQLTGTGEPGKDPHVWLDPVLMKAMAAEVVSILNDTTAWEGKNYPPLTFSSRDVAAQLDDLDRDIRGQLTGCARKDVVTSHAAFAYFAARYGLQQRGITGLSPEAEPSPKRLAAVADYARSHHVTTIFFESLVSPKVAQTVASEVGAKTAVLDPLESVSGTDDYLTVMRRNAATLHDALGCR